MKISVLIPTYKRPDQLRRCLEGLVAQKRTADEVLVVTQASDRDTSDFLSSFTSLPSLRVLAVTTPGAVAQYNSGLLAVQGDIVAITDDDTIPRPNWLRAIEQHFEQEPDLGGLGGLDLLHMDGRIHTEQARQVGVIQWFGRIVGNHHLGARAYPSVDVLKGANMAFRAEAINGVLFDTDLRGGGAQTCLDLGFSLQVRKRGWRLLYDPAVAVDHFPAKRFDADQRGRPSPEAAQNTSFNLYLTLLRHMRPGWRRTTALLWARTVGIEVAPGLVRWLRWKLTGDKNRLALREAANKAWKQARQIAAAEEAAGNGSMLA